MRKLAGLLILVGLLAGCGTTPEPTVPPPTQTPWIIVVTATPGPESVAEVQPTQTPWIIIATPTRLQKPTSTPTERATAGATGTAKATATEAQSTSTATEAQSALTPTEVQSTATARPARSTNTPEPESLRYVAPKLLNPPDRQVVAWNSTLTLFWQGVGDLKQDEYYHVHLDRPPKVEALPWYGDYVYTKDTRLVLAQSFLAPFHLDAEHGEAVILWWVRVVRKVGEDESGKPVGVDISMPSEKRTLVFEAQPGD